MNEKFHETLARMSNAARHIAVVTVGNIRQCGEQFKSRINIENTRQLKQSGFSVGTKFKVSYSKGMVEVVADNNGTNIIAPKRFGRRDGSEVTGERLDLRSFQIHEKFNGEEKVLALYLDGRIVFMHLPTKGRGLERAEKLIDAIKSGKLRTAAFYAGIGTLDAALHEGFEKEGIHSEIAFANDSWDVAIDAMLNDNPAVGMSTRTFTGGIEQFVASGMRLNDIDLAVIGIPCKGASKLNVGTRDMPEFHPWAGHQVLNAVMALQQMDFPPLVLIENVTAYASTASLSMITRIFEEQGYDTQLVGDRDENGVYKGINSNHYGDIERRVRMALLAYPKGVTISFDGMNKTGPSVRTVGDIRLPDHMVDPAEYEKGKHLNRQEKLDKGWRNRIVDDADNITPSTSADCWKQRVEDPKLRHQTDSAKCRLPLPEEHAALKGHDPKLINSLVANSNAHTALGNGTAKRCWVEFARTLAASLRECCDAWGKPRANKENTELKAGQMNLFAF
jgi:DNA (cytosine-5)-methyltransferase 1